MKRIRFFFAEIGAERKLLFGENRKRIGMGVQNFFGDMGEFVYLWDSLTSPDRNYWIVLSNDAVVGFEGLPLQLGRDVCPQNAIYASASSEMSVYCYEITEDH